MFIYTKHLCQRANKLTLFTKLKLLYVSKVTDDGSFLSNCTFYTVYCIFSAFNRHCQHRAFTFTVTYCAFELPQEVFSSSDLAGPAHGYIKASEPFLLRRCRVGAPALCATSRSRPGTPEKCVARVRRVPETPTSTNQVFYS